MSEFHHANEIEKHYSWYFCSISQSSQEFLASVQNEAKIIEFYIRLRDDLSKTRKLLLSSKKKFPLKCDYYEEIFCGRIKSDNLNCSQEVFGECGEKQSLRFQFHLILFTNSWHDSTTIRIICSAVFLGKNCENIQWCTFVIARSNIIGRHTFLLYWLIGVRIFLICLLRIFLSFFFFVLSLSVCLSLARSHLCILS